MHHAPSLRASRRGASGARADSQAAIDEGNEDVANTNSVTRKRNPTGKCHDNVSKITIALALLSFTAAPSRSHDRHAHESFSAGEPGDPNKPSRTIEVLLNEMDFTPARIEVARGEQIRFVLRNVGAEDHEFLLATTAEN